MNKLDSLIAFSAFAGLALLAASLGQLHVVLAWVGYPIAVIAALIAAQSLWQAGALHWGYTHPPANGEDDIAAGLVAVFWVGLVVIEVAACLTALIVVRVW